MKNVNKNGVIFGLKEDPDGVDEVADADKTNSGNINYDEPAETGGKHIYWKG